MYKETEEIVYVNELKEILRNMIERRIIDKNIDIYQLSKELDMRPYLTKNVVDLVKILRGKQILALEFYVLLLYKLGIKIDIKFDISSNLNIKIDDKREGDNLDTSDNNSDDDPLVA